MVTETGGSADVDYELRPTLELDELINAQGATVTEAVGAAAHQVGLVSVPDSELGELADHVIAVVVGPEFIADPRLKAGTAQKFVLNTTPIVMVRLGKTFGNLMIDVDAGNEKLLVSLLGRIDAETPRAGLRQATGNVRLAISP